ncbi:MAG: hypothetical protein JW950_02335 [Deltaproteobacteria bacterium]|nr:hypothetical protein [Deltaproteobacteria bacterium]
MIGAIPKVLSEAGAESPGNSRWNATIITLVAVDDFCYKEAMRSQQRLH